MTCALLVSMRVPLLVVERNDVGGLLLNLVVMGWVEVNANRVWVDNIEQVEGARVVDAERDTKREVHRERKRERERYKERGEREMLAQRLSTLVLMMINSCSYSLLIIL